MKQGERSAHDIHAGEYPVARGKAVPQRTLRRQRVQDGQQKQIKLNRFMTARYCAWPLWDLEAMEP